MYEQAMFTKGTHKTFYSIALKSLPTKNISAEHKKYKKFTNNISRTKYHISISRAMKLQYKRIQSNRSNFESTCTR